MAKTSSSPAAPKDSGRIDDIDVSAEMETSYLEYAYSVIYARALPDARDGLKPVQRRILFQMAQMGLLPQHGYVKSARVVGEVMGKLHPHGDTAIYDALVRMAQDFSLRLPLVDGHGNFGSLDDGPAASRYTEARLAPAAVAMTNNLDEDVVDMVPNYDNKLTQPGVLPADIPSLLVNGAAGIAVGMATNMAPHNLGEVVAAADHLLHNPQADVADLIRFVPGPDLPTGGRIIGLAGAHDAYATGRGRFTTRATARIENVTARRKAIVVTELPYQVGPEKVIEKIKEGVQAKRISGVSAVTDLTDRHNGLRMVIEVKTGFDPAAVLEQLYRLTPLEQPFSINAVALVHGQPRTLSLKELLQVWLDHRLEVVRRRSAFRLDKHQKRLHLVEGLLIAILDIDEVIQVIRSSEDASEARGRLQSVFDLSELQAEYILELRLRRLTRFSRIELENEKADLLAQIAELQEILANPGKLRGVVSTEMREVARVHGTPRRTVLLESAPPVPAATTDAPAARAKSGASLEIADEPCLVVLSTTGMVARTAPDALESSETRANHDVLLSSALTTTRSEVGVITSKGRMIKLSALELVSLPASDSGLSLAGAFPLVDLVALERDESVVAVSSLAEDAPPVLLGTAQGVAKRFHPSDVPARSDEWTVINLKDGDTVVGAGPAPDDAEGVFITSGGNLLRFAATDVPVQGRASGGVRGVKVGPENYAIYLGTVAVPGTGFATTVAGDSTALVGTGAETVRSAPLQEFPVQKRGSGGVRIHRFRKGEDQVTLAGISVETPRASTANGQPVDLPEPSDQRTGTGVPVGTAVAAIG